MTQTTRIPGNREICSSNCSKSELAYDIMALTVVIARRELGEPQEIWEIWEIWEIREI